MKNPLSSLFGKSKEEATAPAAAPDYAHVKSNAQAMALCESGELFKILLFPAEFGGEDVPHNVVYVPRGVPEAQQMIVGTLVRFVEEGTINQLTVNPEYKGDSFVPSRILMRAWNSEKPGGEFAPALEVW